jgi:hypothetical protein
MYPRFGEIPRDRQDNRPDKKADNSMSEYAADDANKGH